MLFLNDQTAHAFCTQFPARFDKTMQACRTILGLGCFRLPKKGDDLRRNPINMALFETVSYFMIELLDLPQKNHESIKSKFTKLLSDEEFILSTTYVVDSNKSVKKRFELVEAIIEEIQNA